MGGAAENQMTAVVSMITVWPVPVILAVSLLFALLIDCSFGELPSRWHPVAWMGNFLGWVGGYLTSVAQGPKRAADYKVFWLGALAWCVATTMVLVAAVLIQRVVMQLPGPLSALLLGLVLKPMLAWRMLREEVLAVERALGESLTSGRERLSWLVSRDVALLDEFGVRESAIESLAENLNDSVVAPIFWFVLLGLPGAAVYRLANTADAMWGYHGVYKGRNWEWAGKWAARADDVLSWVPARITALLLMLVARLRGAGLNDRLSASQSRLTMPTLQVLRLEAARTPSPNSGWPMAAMALCLHVRLNKPEVYCLNAAGRKPQPADTLLAAKYASHAVAWLTLVAVAALLVLMKVQTP